jgi:hypothetical protein
LYKGTIAAQSTILHKANTDSSRSTQTNTTDKQGQGQKDRQGQSSCIHVYICQVTSDVWVCSRQWMSAIVIYKGLGVMSGVAGAGCVCVIAVTEWDLLVHNEDEWLQSALGWCLVPRTESEQGRGAPTCSRWVLGTNDYAGTPADAYM